MTDAERLKAIEVAMATLTTASNQLVLAGAEARSALDVEREARRRSTAASNHLAATQKAYDQAASALKALHTLSGAGHWQATGLNAVEVKGARV